ncbi:TetR/AcrR family transcriptional regulator [Tomitella fengzijianii]|uniref:TetR/AcrR family transcriptional regulator n=1 Tax=Tomitella fengzijianii TaxID=2597660 RepID=UPI00131C65CA|nr:TetR/AcrR family transcriptional regulator [Tomitella fengzijianii]
MARKRSLDGGPAVRRSILEVAARLYSERGYAATSIRDLADAAGISSSTMYHHFANKQQILFEIVRDFMRTFDAEIVPALTDPDAAPAERITTAVRLHLEISERDRLQLVVGNPTKSALTEPQRTEIAGLQRIYRDAFVGAIKDGVAAGDFDVAQPTVTTSAILDMLNGVREWIDAGGPLTLEQIVTQYQALTLRMLGSPPPR